MIDLNVYQDYKTIIVFTCSEGGFMMTNTIITIARSYGSGGRTIGKTLSRQMQVPYYDRNLIYLASQKSGIALRQFSENDEEIKKVPFRDMIPDETKKYVSKDDIFVQQAAIVRQVADQGDCIIIGRCANHILKNSGHRLVRVFIWAPDENCIKTVMEKFSIKEAEALKMIRQIDKHRQDYFRYHTGTDWSSAKNYDLCLDTSRYTYESAADMIVRFAEIMAKT